MINLLLRTSWSFLWILTLYVLFIFSISSQPVLTDETKEPAKESIPENQISKSDDINSASERRGFLGLRRKNGAKYISLSPGILYSSSALKIATNYGTALMDDTKANTESTQFLYDIKSREWQLGEYWGIFLLNRNIRFRQTRQVVSYGIENSDGSSNRNTVDLGTETTGNYSILLPVLYLGSAKEDSFRIGAGLGIGRMNLSGTADINGGIGSFVNAAIFNTGKNIDEKIDNLGRYSLLSTGNLDNDPYRLYLLSNLSQGDNLENLALYSMLRGDIRASSLQPLSLLMYNSITNGTLNPLELIALSVLGQGQVNSSSKLAKSFYIFWEIPFGGINFRLGGGGPFYEGNGYRVSINGFELSIYAPIEL